MWSTMEHNDAVTTWFRFRRDKIGVIKYEIFVESG